MNGKKKREYFNPYYKEANSGAISAMQNQTMAKLSESIEMQEIQGSGLNIEEDDEVQINKNNDDSLQ